MKTIAEDPPTSTRSLLVCDDNAEIREFLRLGLSQYPSIRVVGEAENGRDAVELASNLRPDLVILDLGMPIMDGVEALPQIVKAVPGASILVLSGASISSTEAAIISDHAAAFIAKGATIADVFSKIDEIYQEKIAAETVGALQAEAERVQHALEATETTFKALVQNLRDVVVVLKPDGSVSYVSPAVREVTGFEVDEVLGQSALSFIHPDDIGKVTGHLQTVLQQPGKSTSVEARLKNSSGDWIWIEIRGTNRVDDRAIGGVLLTYHDITPRRRAEEASARLMTEKEGLANRFRSLLDSTGEGIYGIDESGICTFINSAAAKMLGGAREQFEGRSMHALVHHTRADGTEYPRKDCPIYHSFARGNSISIENEVFWRLDGTPFPVEYSSHPLWEGSGLNGAVIAFKDVTARRTIEGQLRAQESLFHGAFASAHTGIALIDSDGMTYVDVNDALCRMLGYTKEELLQLNWLSITHPDDREHNLQATQDFFAGRDDVSLVSKRYVRKDGQVLWVEIADAIVRGPDGTPRNFVTHVTDVTQQKTAMIALEESRALLQAVVNNSPALIYIKDRDGRYLLTNDRYLELRGLTREQMIGRTVPEVFPAGVAETIEENDGRVFQDLVPIEVEETAVDAQGRERTYLSLRFPLFDAGGECHAICGIDTEITDRVQAEMDRKGLEAQLRQAQKMEAVGQLAGGIAHDFNNILAVILNYAEFVTEDLDEGDSRAEDVRQISDAATKAAQLVRQLLAFSRKEVMEPKITDLNEVVRDIETLLQRTVGEDVDLTFEASDETPPIAADRGQLEQIVLNLVVNARDAMPEGGSLRIATSAADIEEGYRTGLAAGRYATLAVFDSGMGMDASTAERIFEPFFTTKPRGEGTGLGLATVYGIVKQSGGGIWVDSAVGRGTTFTIYFPAIEGEVVKDTRERVSRKVTGTETVVIVEDEEAVRALTFRILTKHGFEVVAFESADEALRYCVEHIDEVDVLLTDVVMPDMSGKALSDAIGSRTPGLTTVYMSGYTDDIIAQRGILSDSEYLVSKPFTATQLVTKLRETLDKERNR